MTNNINKHNIIEINSLNHLKYTVKLANIKLNTTASLVITRPIQIENGPGNGLFTSVFYGKIIIITIIIIMLMYFL